jgi:alanine-synthesizing transaminase
MKRMTGCPTSTICAPGSPATRALVVINPNNPTGALYPDSVLREMVAIAREHGLIIYADESV